MEGESTADVALRYRCITGIGCITGSAAQRFGRRS
jgi:hypothetical protein